MSIKQKNKGNITKPCFLTLIRITMVLLSSAIENVSHNGLISSIKKYCSSLAQIDADKIRLRYCDEDCDMVNVCQADYFCVLGNAFYGERP